VVRGPHAKGRLYLYRREKIFGKKFTGRRIRHIDFDQLRLMSINTLDKASKMSDSALQTGEIGLGQRRSNQPDFIESELALRVNGRPMLLFEGIADKSFVLRQLTVPLEALIKRKRKWFARQMRQTIQN